MHLPPTTQTATERSELGGNSPRSLFNLKGGEMTEKGGEEEGSAASVPPGQVLHPGGKTRPPS